MKNWPQTSVCVAILVAAGLSAVAGTPPSVSNASRVPPAAPRVEEPSWLAGAIEAQTLEELREAVEENGQAFGAAVPFNQADIFFEENATDSDLGIHFGIDHSSEDAWRRVMVFFPDGTRFMNIRTGGAEAETGVTGLFTESAEPNYDNLPRPEFLARFPEGVYTFVGWTINGNMLLSTDVLSHDIPAPPQLITPVEGGEVEFDRPLVVRWNGVADPAPPTNVIVGYEVIVTRPAEAGKHKRVVSIELRANQRSVRIPREFFEADTEYVCEVIARETSHNQTISEVSFRTEADD